MSRPNQMSEQPKNLDAKLNQLGYQLVEDICQIDDMAKRKQFLRNIDKSLGVLVNDGVYAYYLFWKAQTSKKEEEDYKSILIGKIAESLSPYVSLNYSEKDQERFFQELSKDLKKLLFFREMLEKILIYARYHAKAKGEDNG